MVLATGTPVLDRGGFFARLAPNVAAALLTAGFDGLGLAPEVWSCAVLAVVAVVVAVTTVALRLRRADRE